MRKLVVLVFGLVSLSFTALAQRPDLPGSLVIDIGLNSWSDVPTNADLNSWRSKTVNITYFYDFPIGTKGLSFTPGIALGLEKYTFDNNFTLTTSVNNNNNRVVAVESLESVYGVNNVYDVSKLGLNYLDLPIEFRYYTNSENYSRGFRFALGAKVGVLYSSFTKVKFEDALAENRQIKDRQQLGVNRIRYGVQGRIGVGGFSFFGYYSLSDLFETAPPAGTNTRTLTIGISLTGF